MKIGVDIGGSHITIGLVDENNNIKNKKEKDFENRDNLKQQILSYLDAEISKYEITNDIDCIGISLPGNPKGTAVENLNNFGIDYLDFKELGEKYNTRLNVVNDGVAAAIAEKNIGAMKGSKDSIYLCIGTGIGSAVYLNGELLKCNKNSGFEIGHMVIERHGIQCSCGKKGCFETYCSMRKLKNDIKELLAKEENDEDISDGIKFKKFLEENYKSENVKKIVNEYIENFVIGLSNLIDIFEPEIICLGGSFAYYENTLYKSLVDEVEKRKYVFNKQSPLPKIVLAKFKNDSGVVGATIA